MKRILSVIMCLILILLMSGCGKSIVLKGKPFNKKTVDSRLSSDTVIAENESFTLNWVSSNQSIILEEKATGKQWGSSPPGSGEIRVDESGLPIKTHPNVNSMLTVSYLDIETYQADQAISYTSANSNGRLTAKLIDNGIRIEYYFDDIEIMVPVELILREDSVSVSVDPKQIQENQNRLISVSIAPFWCCAENDLADSYLFYPSGSGALISNASLSSQGITYSSAVYGRDPVMTLNDMISTEKAVRLPVYGAKNGDIATCAIIEQGAESAMLEAKIGSTALKYSSVYAIYNVRGYSSNQVRFLSGTIKEQEVFTSNLSENVMTIGFYPLSGEKANYSGMAEIYKNYLKREEKLSAVKDESDLGITFVGGVMVKKSFLGVPYNVVLPATELGDVQKILTDLKAEVNADIDARLIGFGKGGLDASGYAGDYAIDSKLGSKKDLSKLNDYCKENGIGLYFDFDLMKLKSSSQGYSALFDTAYNSLGKLATAYTYNVATRSRIAESGHSFLKREHLLESSEKLLKKIKKWNIEGISLEALSQVAYSDYSNKETTKYFSKGNMARDYQKITSEISKQKKLAVADANAYAVVNADVVYDAPTYSSQENIFTADIPFYSMVFKGYASMNCEALNTSDAYELQLLRAVESGVGLHYILTNDYYTEFIGYNGSYFYGSKYSDVKQKITEAFGRLNEYYAAIKGNEIVSHFLLENGLRKTEFSGGMVVFVNYSDSAVMSPLGEVSAYDFVWEK